MAITNKQGIEIHNDCTMVIIPRLHKGKHRLIPGLYCQDHGCLIQWLTPSDYKKLVKLGVEDLGPIPSELEQVKQQKLARKTRDDFFNEI